MNIPKTVIEPFGVLGFPKPMDPHKLHLSRRYALERYMGEYPKLPKLELVSQKITAPSRKITIVKEGTKRVNPDTFALEVFHDGDWLVMEVQMDADSMGSNSC